MHIFFSGIGGAGIGPLAQIALQAGYEVSGSDKQNSQYIDYLRKNGISDIYIGQKRENIAALHEKNPIDWFVYTSALKLESANPAELEFCTEQSIKISKRDELLNQILADKNLKLIAVAGTHGKTTTTAMITWLFKQLDEQVSYLLPAKTNFAQMGEFNQSAEYFIYEADEFDRNFLAYEPYLSTITGVSWDHHEIFPTREDYQAAFREFIDQSQHSILWQEDADYLQLNPSTMLTLMSRGNNSQNIKLKGFYNRLDAWLAVESVHRLTNKPAEILIDMVNNFPGLSRRMEKISPNLYSDYAHTPEKIRGAMSVALEMAAETGQKVIIIYEPLTNRRQLYMLNDYKDVFKDAAKVYWIPSYLAREDPAERIVTPQELISHLDDPSIAVPMERNSLLKQTIEKHLNSGDMVVALAGGGGGSLDDWLRQEFSA
jgi:UDP-N-acetylmuramate--alanine ligase